MKNITMYTGPMCNFCDAAKRLFARNNLTYKKRIKLDLNYVENYNLIMDIRILIRTIGVVLFPLDRGAY